MDRLAKSKDPEDVEKKSKIAQEILRMPTIRRNIEPTTHQHVINEHCLDVLEMNFPIEQRVARQPWMSDALSRYREERQKS